MWRYRQDLADLFAWFRKRKPYPINITSQMSGWSGDPETNVREKSGVAAWKQKHGISRVN